MEDLGFHFTPLLFIPGVALLVASTSTRLMNLNNRLQDLAKDDKKEIDFYKERIFLFRKALVSFYLCIGFFAFVTLLYCLPLSQMKGFVPAIQVLMTIGVLMLFHGILLMIKESWIAMKHLKELDSNQAK